MDVDHLNGRETATVMMKTTMTAATMMVEIVVVTMSTPNIVLPVNVLILILEVMIAVKMTAKTSNPQPGVKKGRENVTSLELPKIVQKTCFSCACVDLKPTSWCEKKKGKCNKNHIKQKCPLTCGVCTASKAP